MTLAGGAWIFAAFIILYTLAVIFGLYTRSGSGINQRPYGDAHHGAAGAKIGSVLDHDESAATRYTRGTRSRAARTRRS